MIKILHTILETMGKLKSRGVCVCVRICMVSQLSPLWGRECTDNYHFR